MRSRGQSLLIASFAAVLFLAAILVKESNMDKPIKGPALLKDAQKQLKLGNHAQARLTFVEALNHGAEENLCLEGVAECGFALFIRGTFDAKMVKIDCKLLRKNGYEARALYYEGAIAEFEKDRESAVKLFQASADLGDARAQQHLNKLKG